MLEKFFKILTLARISLIFIELWYANLIYHKQNLQEEAELKRSLIDMLAFFELQVYWLIFQYVNG